MRKNILRTGRDLLDTFKYIFLRIFDKNSCTFANMFDIESVSTYSKVRRMTLPDWRWMVRSCITVFSGGLRVEHKNAA